MSLINNHRNTAKPPCSRTPPTLYLKLLNPSPPSSATTSRSASSLSLPDQSNTTNSKLHHLAAVDLSKVLSSSSTFSSNPIAITAALGFDSFLAMRHGAGPNISVPDCDRLSKSRGDDVSTVSARMETLSTKDGDGSRRLGCYFCNDIVAPIDSTSNRTLDQQCTVTRPGLAPIASALAVELLVGILHHPNGIYASGEIASSIGSSSELPLGILPHQIRGSLSQFSQMTLIGYSSNSCTACSTTVVSEYRRRGMEFILQAINYPTYLEDLTGLTELMKSASNFQLDWEDETEEDVDDF